MMATTLVSLCGLIKLVALFYTELQVAAVIVKLGVLVVG
jgi:hypothetical protein